MGLHKYRNKPIMPWFPTYKSSSVHKEHFRTDRPAENQPTNQPLLPVPGLIETGSAPSIAYLYQNPFLYSIIPARYGLVNLPVGTVR